MKLTHDRAAYDRAFALEQQQVYPVMDAIEQSYGLSVGRGRLEAAARILACPVKAHPPCWQHGRLLYVETRRYLQSAESPVTLLDIGTAKGFSALCLLWALQDAGCEGAVTSVDVIDPKSHTLRNTVAECDRQQTLYDVLTPWPEAEAITFLHTTGIDWLLGHAGRVHVAYVDGKHAYDVVKREGELLAQCQEPGDLAIFDDCQIDGVRKAVNALGSLYVFTPIELKTERAYAVGRRR